MKTDVADEASKSLAASAWHSAKNGRIEVLINNAAWLHASRHDIEERARAQEMGIAATTSA